MERDPEPIGAFKAGRSHVLSFKDAVTKIAMRAKLGQVEPTEMPASTTQDLAAVNGGLATSIHTWLKRRKKNVRPKLSGEQQHQLKECFELMDQDGSGAIDADELGAAFRLLGLGLRKAEIEDILGEVGQNVNGEVEYPQFLEIMTCTLQRLAEEQAEDGGKRQAQVPFSLMATAYRRKRLMEGIISGDKETMGQIVQLSERQAQEAAAHAAALAAAAARSAKEKRGGGEGEGVDAKRLMSSIAKRSLARLANMHVDEGLLARLGPEERRLLSMVAAKAQPQAPYQQGHAYQRSVSTGTARMRRFSNRHPSELQQQAPQEHQRAATAWDARLPPLGTFRSHYSMSPTYKQLVGVPQVFELKFTRPTVQVSGSFTSRSAIPMPSATARTHQTS